MPEKILLNAKETANLIGISYHQFLKLYHEGSASIPKPRNAEPTFLRWSIYDIWAFYGKQSY